MSLQPNIMVESYTPEISSDLDISVPRDLTFLVTLTQQSRSLSQASLSFQHVDKGKQPVHASSNSLPPIILAFIPLSFGQTFVDPTSTHSMIMDNVIVVLQGSPTDHVSEDEKGSQEESDDEMSDDVESADMMTLVQY